MERVVAVELNPNAKQSDLVNALEPVSDRIMKRYKAAQETLKAAKAREDAVATEAAQILLLSQVVVACKKKRRRCLTKLSRR